MHTAYILGAQTSRDTQLLVEGILSSTWQEQFSTVEMRIMAVAIGVVSVVAVIQIMHYFFRKVYKIKNQWWKLPLRIVMDVLLFVVLVVGQFYLQNFVERVRAPRAVQYARSVPQILSISYRTYDLNYSIVNWGYDPEHLDYVELGANSSTKTRKHDFNIPVQANSPVYFRIHANGEFYGQKQENPGIPYLVIVNNEEQIK